MNVKTVATFFKQIEQTASRIEMTELLACLLKETTPVEAKIISYLSLGEMNPPYKNIQFQLAEKMVIRALARVMQTSEAYLESRLKEVGDVGLLIQEREQQVVNDISIESLYASLQVITESTGKGSQETKLVLIEELLSQLDNMSAQYVLRILVGKLRLGFSDMTLLDAFSWMMTGDKSLKKIIEHAYNICADIGEIAYRAKAEGVDGLERMAIHIGIPIRPAAAERLPTAKDIVEKLGVGCVAQPKLDGFRLQIHLDKRLQTPSVHFFSRNLVDMSAMFPDLIESFTKLDCQTLICEGEAIVVDPHTGIFVPFQETVKRKRKHGIEEAAEELPLKVFIFDVLYLNGNSLLALSHAERRAIAQHLFPKEGQVTLIDEEIIESAEQLEHYFYQNIEAGLEGLVVKRRDSLYQPGKRNFNWIKLKRQEEGHLEDTVDCVVLGYYYGQGKRARFGIGGFLVGIYNAQRDMFEAITKIGTGLKDEEWINLKNRLDAIAVQEQPKEVECVKELHPHVWVEPTIVVMIRADEITKSPRYTAGKEEGGLGYALRFPRFMGYRDDKSARDATTPEEIRQLYKNQKLLLG